jgi:hypothetical protein
VVALQITPEIVSFRDPVKEIGTFRLASQTHSHAWSSSNLTGWRVINSKMNKFKFEFIFA